MAKKRTNTLKLTKNDPRRSKLSPVILKRHRRMIERLMNHLVVKGAPGRVNQEASAARSSTIKGEEKTWPVACMPRVLKVDNSKMYRTSVVADFIAEYKKKELVHAKTKSGKIKKSKSTGTRSRNMLKGHKDKVDQKKPSHRNK